MPEVINSLFNPPLAEREYLINKKFPCATGKDKMIVLRRYLLKLSTMEVGDMFIWKGWHNSAMYNIARDEFHIKISQKFVSGANWENNYWLITLVERLNDTKYFNRIDTSFL